MPIKRKDFKNRWKSKNSLPDGFLSKLTWIFFLCLKNFQPSGREFSCNARYKNKFVKTICYSTLQKESNRLNFTITIVFFEFMKIGQRQ
ncbi:hypothetical protein HR11_07440 [Porphyromonas macacae]|nr:hypothetical protein HR11_07440 [Porphyromonas macacae]